MSDPPGLEHESEVRSSTFEQTTLRGREDVNNVHKFTSPKYVEIRRTPPPSTELYKKDVNNMHKSIENYQVDKVTENEYERVFDGNSFSFGSSTESIRKLVRPETFTPSKVDRTTTPIFTATTNYENEIQSFRGRNRSAHRIIESTSNTPEIKSPFNRYTTINRNTSEKPSINEHSTTSSFPTREITNTADTVTASALQVDSGNPRRYHFAARTRPAVLTSKSEQSVKPKLSNSETTKNSLGATVSSLSAPEVTVKPTTNVPFITNVDENFGVTLFGRARPFQKIRNYSPTTSTQTSVVTSITESLFTERKRILIPKKMRLNSNLSCQFNKCPSVTTTETDMEITTPPYGASGYRTVSKSTTPISEVQRYTRQRYKSKSTTMSTTTEEPQKTNLPYTSARTKNLGKPIGLETAVVPSISTTPRVILEQHSVKMTPTKRFGSIRKRKINSAKEEVDDLDADQTESYREGVVQNGDVYLLADDLRLNQRGGKSPKSSEINPPAENILLNNGQRYHSVASKHLRVKLSSSDAKNNKTLQHFDSVVGKQNINGVQVSYNVHKLDPPIVVLKANSVEVDETLKEIPLKPIHRNKILSKAFTSAPRLIPSNSVTESGASSLSGGNVNRAAQDIRIDTVSPKFFNFKTLKSIFQESKSLDERKQLEHKNTQLLNVSTNVYDGRKNETIKGTSINGATRNFTSQNLIGNTQLPQRVIRIFSDSVDKGKREEQVTATKHNKTKSGESGVKSGWNDATKLHEFFKCRERKFENGSNKTCYETNKVLKKVRSETEDISDKTEEIPLNNAENDRGSIILRKINFRKLRNNTLELDNSVTGYNSSREKFKSRTSSRYTGANNFKSSDGRIILQKYNTELNSKSIGKFGRSTTNTSVPTDTRSGTGRSARLKGNSSFLTDHETKHFISDLLSDFSINTTFGLKTDIPLELEENLIDPTTRPERTTLSSVFWKNSNQFPVVTAPDPAISSLDNSNVQNQSTYSPKLNGLDLFTSTPQAIIQSIGEVRRTNSAGHQKSHEVLESDGSVKSQIATANSNHGSFVNDESPKQLLTKTRYSFTVLKNRFSGNKAPDVVNTESDKKGVERDNSLVKSRPTQPEPETKGKEDVAEVMRTEVGRPSQPLGLVQVTD